MVFNTLVLQRHSITIIKYVELLQKKQHSLNDTRLIGISILVLIIILF